MPTSQAEPVQEVQEVQEVEEVKAKPKRGRAAAPAKNYKTIFSTEEECDNNPPCDEDDEPIDSFRTYTVKCENEIMIPAGSTYYVAARNTDQALAFVASGWEVTSEVSNPAYKGRQRKIDPMMLKYLVMMHTIGMPEQEIEAFYTGDDGKFEHYRKLDLSAVKSGLEHKAANDAIADSLIAEHCTQKKEKSEAA